MPAINVEPSFPVLAFELGASNVASLVHGSRVVDRRRMLLGRSAGPGAWLDAAAGIATTWRGRFRRAVLVEPDGGSGALAAGLARRVSFPVTSLPQVQAAAWGEHRFGAAPGNELVFLSAGWTIEGAVVTGGALFRGSHGLAGQLGRLRVQGARSTVTEVAGAAALLRRAGPHGARDLAALLAAAGAGSRWAVLLMEDAAAALAEAIGAVQAVLDPPVVVLGGAIGAAPGFIRRLEGRLAELTPRPTLAAATLGADAALLGAADHATAQAGILALTAG